MSTPSPLSYFFLGLCCMLMGCSSHKSPPDNLIPEDTYIDLVVEFQLAESYQQSLPADSSISDSLSNLIFEKYDISKTQFLESQSYYRQNVANHKQQIEKAIERLKIDQTTEDALAIPVDDSLRLN